MSSELRQQLIDIFWVILIMAVITLSVFLPWCIDCS